MKTWTQKEIENAIAVLKASVTVPAACEKLTRRMKRPVDVSNLRALFARRGLPKPADLVKEPPASNPVARAQESAAAKRLREENRELIARVKEAEARDKLHQALENISVPPIRRRELGSGLREGTLVALLSDIHSEELIVPSQATAWNAYSLEIADMRIGRFFSGIEWMIDFKRSKFGLRDVVIWYGGDLMTGHLHQDNVESAQLSPIETILWLEPRLINGIRQLLQDSKIERLTLVCSYGNHGRNSMKPMRAKGAAHSYEWAMYQHIGAELKKEFGDRVQILANPDGHQYLIVYGFNLHFHHGDETSYGGGVGGVMISINKAVSQWDKVLRCDLHHFGHWHTYMDSGSVTLNGSGIGYGLHSMSVKATPEPAQQACYILDSKRGKTEMTKLWLEDRSAENPLRIARGWCPWPETNRTAKVAA